MTGDTTHDITVSDVTETEDNLNKTTDSVIEIMDVTCEEVKENSEEQSSAEIDANDVKDKDIANDDRINKPADNDTDNKIVASNDADSETATNKEENAEEAADVSLKEAEPENKESQSETPVETSQNTPAEELQATQESLSILQPMDTQESVSSEQINTQESASNSQHINYSQASSVPSTPENKAGHVKITEYGTPVMNIASSYVKLPSDDKFAKDICDVINFENLPNSTGKYKQISALLRKVKSEVDRIQDS